MFTCLHFSRAEGHHISRFVSQAVTNPQIFSNQILSLCVGQAALDRIPEGDKQRFSRIPSDKASAFCANAGAPLDVLKYHVVREGNGALKVGSALAVLSYPIMVDPKFELQQLKHCIRSIVKNNER
jgi:hypothetical protein